MAQSYPEPWMDKYWNLRHLLLDVAHLGQDEFARVAEIMGAKFSKGENWPHEMFDTLYDYVMISIQKGESARYADLIKAIVQTLNEQINSLANVKGANTLIDAIQTAIKDLEQELN